MESQATQQAQNQQQNNMVKETNEFGELQQTQGRNLEALDFPNVNITIQNKDFISLRSKLNDVQRQISQLDSVFSGQFQTTTSMNLFLNKNAIELQKITQIFGNKIVVAYPQEHPLYQNANKVQHSQLQGSIFYQEYNKEQKQVVIQFKKWINKFKQLNQKLGQRDRAQKLFKHYFDKLINLNQQKSGHDNKGTFDSRSASKLINRIIRNEEKQQKALFEYEKLNNLCYQLMQDYTTNKYQVLTPIVTNYVQNQVKLFQHLNQAYIPLKDMEFKANLNLFDDIGMSSEKPLNHQQEEEQKIDDCKRHISETLDTVEDEVIQLDEENSLDKIKNQLIEQEDQFPIIAEEERFKKNSETQIQPEELLSKEQELQIVKNENDNQEKQQQSTNDNIDNEINIEKSEEFFSHQQSPKDHINIEQLENIQQIKLEQPIIITT